MSSPAMSSPSMSSPAMSSPSMSSPAMSTPAKSSVNVQSCDVHPCELVRHCPVLQCPTPFFYSSVNVQSCNFSQPILLLSAPSALRFRRLPLPHPLVHWARDTPTPTTPRRLNSPAKAPRCLGFPGHCPGAIRQKYLPILSAFGSSFSASPPPLVHWGGNIPSSYTKPLGAFGASTLPPSALATQHQGASTLHGPIYKRPLYNSACYQRLRRFVFGASICKLHIQFLLFAVCIRKNFSFTVCSLRVITV